MRIRYHLDADTGLPHVAHHGVAPREVEDGEGVFVVTAFDIRGKPLKAHNRRMKRRGNQ